MLSNFESYPFEKLRVLLHSSTPPKDKPLYALTIGEPQFSTPQNIIKAWQDSAALLNKYPASSGEDYLKDAQLGFIKNRYNLSLSKEQIIPTFGTREVLFNFPQFYLYSNQPLSHLPTIAYPNPFYQIYEGAALATHARVIHMNLRADSDFKPMLSKEQLKSVDLVILNSPNNPTGRILSLEELSLWVKYALEYDFVILSDECYSEIYKDSPPPSILEASIHAKNLDFKNILALNSISKRSSAPGLRSGYIAGDAKILKSYSLYRTYLGCALPLPLQKAAAVAWSDMEAPEQSRHIYTQNLTLAKEILGLADSEISPYTFYVWLEVGDDEAFCRFAYENFGVMVLPGSYLGRNGEGKGYVRIALVYDTQSTKEALYTLKNALELYKKRENKA